MSLEGTKQRLSQNYLGKDGIHGIGMSRAQNALRVHLVPAADAQQAARQEALLDQLKQDAAPYAVFVRKEEAPRKA